MSRRTFLKVFVEVADAPDEKSDGDISASSPGSQNGVLQSQSQYCTLPISPTSTAAEVIGQVARKRNLLYKDNQYELVMCDGDGQASYETILGSNDQPHQFQQSAAKHGHLGDFHFVFRKAGDDASDNEDSSEGESEPDIFGTVPQQVKHGKYPAAWMEKRGKTHRAWRRRYFVLINNELLYYKRRDVYETGKDPIARIELVNPPGIIKILPPETTRKGTSVLTLFCFDIHTPRRIYSLRTDNYNEMLFWVKALSRRNEPNELIDGLQALVCESEVLHCDDDERMMDKFGTLRSILTDKDATDAYVRYLQSIHNEEFIHFWLDVQQYLANFEAMDADRKLRFARELYDKYIKSGGKYQLSEIKSKLRSALKKEVESGTITKDMFASIQESVFDYLNRDSYKFFNSSEYFRFIVTCSQHADDDMVSDASGVDDEVACGDAASGDGSWVDKYMWPCEFEQAIDAKNAEKHRYIMSSNQSIIHNHTDHTDHYKNMSVHSPVLRGPSSPTMHRALLAGSSGGSSGGSFPYKGGLSSKSWTNSSAFDDKASPNVDVKKLTKRRSKHAFSRSIFENAPGIASGSGK